MSDKIESHHGTPEEVAFRLMERISKFESFRRGYEEAAGVEIATDRDYFLQLYAECLKVVAGKKQDFVFLKKTA